jgi:hypothetical protein
VKTAVAAAEPTAVQTWEGQHDLRFWGRIFTFFDRVASTPSSHTPSARAELASAAASMPGGATNEAAHHCILASSFKRSKGQENPFSLIANFNAPDSRGHLCGQESVPPDVHRASCLSARPILSGRHREIETADQ